MIQQESWGCPMVRIQAGKHRLKPVTSLFQCLSDRSIHQSLAVSSLQGLFPTTFPWARSCPSVCVMLFHHPAILPTKVLILQAFLKYHPLQEAFLIPILVIPLGFSIYTIQLVVSGFCWTRGFWRKDLGLRFLLFQWLHCPTLRTAQ